MAVIDNVVNMGACVRARAQPRIATAVRNLVSRVPRRCKHHHRFINRSHLLQLLQHFNILECVDIRICGRDQPARKQ